jgi:Fur family zinc uptake transcriptional regulator
VKVLRKFTHDGHKHAACIAGALSVAEGVCHKGGFRLTPMRRRVLELVWESHGPVKAYDLLDEIRTEKKGAAPPTVYRALDFLQQQGFVHKIESLNAYIGCGAPGHEGTGQILICRSCGQVAELDDPEIIELISAKAFDLGFVIAGHTIEMKGQCTGCRNRS